jgi:EAL domain-containing protein (putative c-di-GMP-specific phosphodiesterase class I)/GGDEF domain-containing protein
LRAVARRLEGSLRATDLIARVGADAALAEDVFEHTLARLGGDEFVILLHGMRTEGDAERVAVRIQQALSQPFQVAGRDLFVTASIGIALSKPEYASPDEMLRDADTAMYRAKALGVGQTALFSVSMREQALERIQLDAELRRALERQEFLPFYQPIVDLQTGLLAGFEALLRWRHPTRGILAPADFMSAVEENGLLQPIGRRFLHDVCQQLRHWQDAYPAAGRLWVNVNFSSQQFLEIGLASRLIESLDTAGLAAHHLVVEITERTAIENFSLTASVLEHLRDAGIRVVLDDFGTGYSSLSCLHQLPISGLKLDPTFIQGDGPRPGVLRAVISIAESLDLSLTAEGIETAEQCQRLRELGCDFAQGFLFARPLDPEAAEHALEADALWLPWRLRTSEAATS